MKLKVQQLQNSYGMGVAVRYQWFPEKGFTGDFIVMMNDFYTTDWPNKITIDNTWICELRHSNSLGGVQFNVTFDGSKPEYDRAVDKYVKKEDLKVQPKQRVLAETSTGFLCETFVNRWMEKTERAYPTNKTYELYSSFIFKNDNKDTVQNVTAIIRDLMKILRDDFKGEQANFMVTWIRSGQGDGEETHRFSFLLTDSCVPHVYHGGVGGQKKMPKPFSLNGETAFINFPGRDFSTKSHERPYFGDNREELRRVKEIWDRDNFLKSVQSVRRPGIRRKIRRRRMKTRQINSQLTSGNTTKHLTL